MEYLLKQKCLNILDTLKDTIELLIERNSFITSINDYLCSPAGVEKLDANCMRLQTIGENLKRFDALTNHNVLPLFKNINWSQIIRMRDFISHHYDGVDPDIVFDIIKNDLPELLIEIQDVTEYIYDIEITDDGR